MSRWAGHEPLRHPPCAGGRSRRAAGASTRLPVHRRPVARRRRVGPGPAPRPAGAVGPDGLLALVAFGGFGAVLYAGLWMFLPGPAAHHAAVAGPGRRHPAGQARRAARAPAGRLRTAGRGRGDRDRRAPADHAGHRPEPVLRAAAARPAPASPCCGGRPTRRSAQRWIDPSRRMNPLRAIVGGGGWRAWLRIVAGPAAADRRHRAVLAALGQPERRPQRRPGRSLRHRRARLHGRPVAAPALLRPQRGARGAGALRGARRRRRPPARLGAPDPGADPALGRRPGAPSPGWPAPRSATCGPGSSTPPARARPRWPPRCAPSPPRSRTRTASTSRWSASATRP